MPKFFIVQNQIKNEKIAIIGQDVNHIKNVLRQKIGDEIIICNTEDSQDYKCKIEKIEEEKIICKIQEKIENNSESNVKVTIFQGLPKADKMEYIIQKSVELGVYDIVPVEMKRCVVKLDEKDKSKKVSRWQKISEVAAKQCGRDIIPEVKDIINIKKLCNLIESYDIVLVAYENEKENTLKEQINAIKKKFDYCDKIKIGVIIRTRRWIRTTRYRNTRR